MKVLYVIDGLGPGGAERSLAELLPLYLAEGIRTVVVCLRGDDTRLSDLVRRHGFEIRVLPGRGLFGRVRALRRMIQGDRPDLVHTTLYNSDVVGRLAAAGTGVPVLTSLVNTSYDPARWDDPNVGRFALWVTQAIDGFTARHYTRHFHAITEAVKTSAMGSLGVPADRITVIERGRSAKRLGSASSERRLAARRRLGLAPDAEVVVNVARQEFQKGQKHLLEAAAILLPERPRLVVLVAGREGHASAALAELRERLALGDRLRMLGNRDDVPEILAAGDVFVFPSVYEGLGGAVLEAMALGLPVVASDLPALREVIEDGRNGILVPPGSGTALAAGLRRLLEDDSTRAAYGLRSAQRFQERFTIERSAARMIALYRRLCASAGTREAEPVRGGSGAPRLAEPETQKVNP